MKDALFDLIFDIVRHIPEGRVTSFGAIARCIGTGGSARIVGWAMHAAGPYPDVPAHRVLNSKGLLTGKHHFATLTRMQELLEQEGIRVKNDKVVDFDRLFWDPASLADE
ncbi:MGMT family protein [Taibaiella koreensis]|uniref:MGMT family protein n=1 Tax=Taibaiella koreensis TaxID=1268548 RepID=UPI000E59916C|nr:MGMT family protein [Taibaiella koreensis]